MKKPAEKTGEKEAPAEETVSAVTEKTAVPVTVTINAAEFLDLAEPASTEELSPAVEEAMAAFMEEQQPFVDLGVPANVSYDAPMPKFSYVMRKFSALGMGVSRGDSGCSVRRVCTTTS